MIQLISPLWIKPGADRETKCSPVVWLLTCQTRGNDYCRYSVGLSLEHSVSLPAVVRTLSPRQLQTHMPEPCSLIQSLQTRDHWAWASRPHKMVRFLDFCLPTSLLFPTCTDLDAWHLLLPSSSKPGHPSWNCGP